MRRPSVSLTYTRPARATTAIGLPKLAREASSPVVRRRSWASVESSLRLAALRSVASY